MKLWEWSLEQRRSIDECLNHCHYKIIKQLNNTLQQNTPFFVLEWGKLIKMLEVEADSIVLYTHEHIS